MEVATTTFRTTTVESFHGFWTPPVQAVAVPGVPSAPGTFAEFQVFAWDNQGGTINSLAALYSNDSVPRGWSNPFTIPRQLGADGSSAVTLQGLESFQLFVIPEPSTLVIGMWGTLLLLGHPKGRPGVSPREFCHASI
jgi:hypothetical protein